MTAPDRLLAAASRAVAWLRAWRWRLRPRALERRLEEELAHHRLRSAERRSDADPGDAGEIRSACRAAYGLSPEIRSGERLMAITWHELLAIVRGLRRSPAFTASALLVLGLGVAATLTLLGVVHAVLFEPLPFPQADRLARVWSVNGENPRASHNPLDLADYAAGASGVEAIAGVTTGSVTWEGSSGSERLAENVVTPGWLGVLGIEPLLGRGFGSEESLPGRDAVVVLSHAFWRDRLGSDPQVVGSSVRLDGIAHTVVGVLPPGVPHPLAWDPPELLRPLTVDPAHASRGGHYLHAVARLAPGASIAAAGAQVQTVAARLEEEHPATNHRRSARLVPLREGVVGDVRRLLAILTAGVFLLLLITAANVGALFLARTLDRRGELAVRTALGAGRSRLLVALGAEGALLGIAGSLTGLLLAVGLRDASAALGLSRLPWGRALRLDGATLGFTLGLAALTAVVLTLPAGVRVGRLRAAPPPGRRGSGRRDAAGRRVLVGAQVALALVLLVSAGLLTESLHRLLAVDGGFDRESVATARLSLPAERYDVEQRVRFFEDLRERMLGPEAAASDPADGAGEAPVLERFGLVNRLPLSQTWSCDSFVPGGRPLPAPGEEDCAEDRVVDPGYFAAMGIHLLEGRLLDSRDRDQATTVVVNRTLARRYWPDRGAVGQRLRWGGPASDAPWQEIVGVVADVRHFGLDGEVRPEVYSTLRQTPWSTTYWVALRTSRSEAAIERLRAAAAELDPAVPVFDVQTMEQRVAGSVETERLRSVLLRLFAGAALVLTAVGVWGLIVQTMARARRELGVRLALGAGAARILRWVAGEGLRPLLLGAAVGLAAAWGAGRLLAGELFGVPALHAPTWIAAAVLLLGVGAAATLLPALRALRLDPSAVLREE